MTYYVGVAVRRSGHAAVTKPYTDLQEMLAELKAYTAKHYADMAFTTYITRTSDKEITLAEVFGHPRSRDLMQDKHFKKEITNG